MTNKLSTSKVILTVILSIFILAFAQIIGGLAHLLPISRGITIMISALLSITITYFLAKQCCTKLLQISNEKCYITKPKLSIRWVIIGLALPILVMAILLNTPGELIKNSMKPNVYFIIISSAIFNAGLAPGIIEEIIFRGLIMKTFEIRWGKKIAIIIPSVLFSVLHIIGLNVNFIDIILLLVAGTSVGVMFSLIVYESGSIWSSAFVHAVWNTFMIGNILKVNSSHSVKSMYSYKLYSTTPLITGGEFGVESSIIGILGYFIIIAIALILMKKKDHRV